MAVPMDDGRVKGGHQDPRVSDATPGCVLRVTPRFVDDHSVITEFDLINSAAVLEQRVSRERIPPIWVEGTQDAFLTRLSVLNGITGTSKLWLDTDFQASNSGITAGPQLTDDAETNWGIVAFNGRGQSAYVTLADMVAAGSSSEPYNATVAWTGAAGLGLNIDGYTILIVDRSHPNVDWARLEFVTVRAGAETNYGNDLALRAITEGNLHLVLHTGSPPTAANRVTGGGYADAAITGPTGWELSSREGVRVIQNTAELAFGTASNVWTRATHIALWTGSAATGNLIWYDTILAFTARLNAEPKVAARAGQIGLPNVAG